MYHFIIKARLILKQNDKILLLAQTSENGGKFTLPGGTVEDKEFAKETLIRECQEELGIHLGGMDLTLVHVLHKKKDNENRITIYFAAHDYEGTLHAKETEKFRGITWAAIDRLPTKTSATVKHVLAKISAGARYSEFSKKSATHKVKKWNW